MVAAGDEDRHRVTVGGRPPYLAGLIAGSAQLRRDVATAVRVGVSPRRYAGWEPRTQYSYDEAGRIQYTQPEPEWDEWDQALVDELLNWQSGVHSCGHHKDEQQNPDTVFVTSYTVCKACESLQRAQEEQAKRDKAAREAGKNPDYARVWRVDSRSVTELTAQVKQTTGEKTPLQRMQEAVAALGDA